jgi:hypothetical protein
LFYIMVLNACPCALPLLMPLVLLFDSVRCILFLCYSIFLLLLCFLRQFLLGDFFSVVAVLCFSLVLI